MSIPGSPHRSPSPDILAQPDHFYGNEDIQLPPSPHSDARNWLDPAEDPTAQRGIPVFKPTLEEFEDFEGYMNRVEPWGMRSGIVKIIPPKEWTERLPSIVPQLDKVRLKNPIEQHMLGQGGLFQQQNIEKRRVLSVREWAELCAKDDMRAPGVDDIGLHARANNGSAKTRTRRARRQNASNGNGNGNGPRQSETAEPESVQGDEAINVKLEQEEDDIPLVHHHPASALISPPNSNRALSPADTIEPCPDQNAPYIVSSASTQIPAAKPHRHPLAEEEEEDEDDGEVKHEIEEHAEEDVKPTRGRRVPQTREAKEAQLAARAQKDRQFLDSFDPQTAWLPPNTTPVSYTTEFCKELERRYWRNCGFGKPPWYGADMQGSLFTDETTVWNVASLPSALTRLLPASSKGLPGVNTPYLYFGMWRATFAWHVEDMDLFSINYIHFGAPKFWYAMPQARANALEQTMKSLFPGAEKKCSQFLRHKSYLASPTLLSKSSCRPNLLVQKAREFVITYPRGYHAGFNLGFNCAESVNFALDSWIDIGRRAKACGCVNFSVRIDVDQLLHDRAAEQREVYRKPKKTQSSGSSSEPEPHLGLLSTSAKPSRKRKAEGDPPSKAKKLKINAASSQKPFSLPSPSSSESPSKYQVKKLTLKLPPRPQAAKPKQPETFPCCLCISMERESLLRVQDPPGWWFEPGCAEAKAGVCMAHEECAMVVPETWVDEIELGEGEERRREKVVFGVDAIVKDRWNLKCTACTKPKNRVHGAPIQCTKGRCPKAFHVSCAREGHANGIVYNVLGDVEKEVVLLDNQPLPVPRTPPQAKPIAQDVGILMLHPNAPAGGALPTGTVVIDPDLSGTGDQLMEMDQAPIAQSVAQTQDNEKRSSSPRVLKTIKKTEVEVLCHQHNPAVLAAKKAQQQDRIRNALIALPPMSRIKLRVTAGVFEVTLVRVIEETCSVEVLWDRGIKREFKWRSVVFGDTDGVVGQKPTEAAPEDRPPPPTGTPSYPINTYRSVAAPSSSQSSANASSQATTSNSSQSVVPPGYSSYYQQAGTMSHQYAPGSWSYQYTAPPPPAGSHSAAQAYTHPSYGQHGFHPQYHYSNPITRPAYSQYPQYNGYGGYVPPPEASTSTTASAQTSYQQQSQSEMPSESESQSQAQAQARARELQWQRPYTGPRVPMSKPLPLTVPTIPRYYPGTYPYSLAVTQGSQSQEGSGSGSLQSVSPAPPAAAPVLSTPTVVDSRPQTRDGSGSVVQEVAVVVGAAS